MTDISGKGTLAVLAETYQQLYLVPGPDGPEQYRNVVLRGRPPEVKSLAHFQTSEADSCLQEATPAGTVQVITLGNRADFELFLQIMCSRCTPEPIPATQGAVHVSGIINRPKVDAWQESWRKEHPDASAEEWNSAFRAFQEKKENYTETLIILSTGPYSAVPAEDLGLEEAEWLRRSMILRKTHECTHFVCRKLFPDQVEAVWDELTADAAGIYASFGAFDQDVAERVLGIRDGQWSGGRLSNYCPGMDEAGLQALSLKIHGLLSRFRELFAAHPGEPVYDLVMLLEKQQPEWAPLIDNL